MPLRPLLSARRLLLLCLFSLCGATGAQTIGSWQSVCWNGDGSSYPAYDRVKVVWTAKNCSSDWRSDLYVNGARIGTVGVDQCSSGETILNGSTALHLSWGQVTQRSPLVAPWSPRFNPGCTVDYEDTGISPIEGTFSFYAAHVLQPVLSVRKTASAPVLVAGAGGQSYTITINVSYGPTTAAIALTDNLPAGIRTSGAISANTGLLSGCPGAGATSLAGCSIAAGASDPIRITVPVTVSAAAASRSSYSVSNTAIATGGGDSRCTGSNCQGSSTNTLLKAVDDSDSQSPGLAARTDVSVNDAFPPGASFSATGGSCSGIGPLAPAGNSTGLLGYTVPPGSSSCSVNYRLCAPAPDTAICATATLTVNADPVLNGRVLIDDGSGAGTAHDAVRNGGEQGHSGVTLRLSNCADTVYASAISAADGSFSLRLAGVPPGQPACLVETLLPAFSPVSIHPGTTGGSYSPASTTLRFSPAANTSYSGVLLGEVPMDRFTGNGAQQAAPGQSVSYAHSFVAGSTGSVVFASSDQPDPALLGWSSVLYLDAACNGVPDLTDSLLRAALNVRAGQRICILNKVTNPAGSDWGVKDSTTVTATVGWNLPGFGPGTAFHTLSTTDTTTVATSSLTLLIETRHVAVCPDSAAESLADDTPWALSGTARPGDALEYRLRFINNTAAPLTDITLNDIVPAWTVFKNALCLSLPEHGLSACKVTQRPAVNAASGGIVWTLTDAAKAPAGLQPQDAGSVGYCVNVQQ